MAKSIGAHVDTRIAEVIKRIAEHYDAIMFARNAEPLAKPPRTPVGTVNEPNVLCPAVPG